jgi:hypothetical protein
MLRLNTRIGGSDSTPTTAFAARDAAAPGHFGSRPGRCVASTASSTVVRYRSTPRPIVLGRGVRLWDGLEALEADYAIAAVSTPSGVTHLTFTR